MDKFELETFEQILSLADDLQLCFIEDDGYSRTPSITEWRRAGRLVRQITLTCHELTGYARAKRNIEAVQIRQQLHIVEELPPAQPPTAFIPEKNNPDAGKSGNLEQGFVEFTNQEILTMPKRIQRLIILQKQRCRLRTRRCGNSYTYEIRLRRDGYNVSATGKTIELAKANMLKRLATAKPLETAPLQTGVAVPTTFAAFAWYYFEDFRKELVVEKTFKKDVIRLQKHLIPRFGETSLLKIGPFECKKMLKEIADSGATKTANEVRSLLSMIFKSAIAHGIIERNPLDVVLPVKHEYTSGKALSLAEQEKLLAEIEPSCRQVVALALYTGLRPNELATARIEGPFIVAVNSKRKHKKVEYKKIPICDRLRAFLPTDGTLTVPSDVQFFRRRFNAVLPEHKFYDLRTTFYSRCKELGISDAALMEYVGHSLGRLGNAYTDLSDEYLLKEGKKLNDW